MKRVFENIASYQARVTFFLPDPFPHNQSLGTIGKEYLQSHTRRFKNKAKETQHSNLLLHKGIQ